MGFLKDHPLISVLGVLVVLGVIGFTAFNFAQGTLLTGDSGCEWNPVTVEDTGQTFSNMNELNDYLDRTGDSIPEGFETQVRDGVVQQRLTECEVTSIGGEA